MKSSKPTLDAAVTLTKLRQEVDNQFKITAVWRRWNDGHLDIHMTEEYDKTAPVYCEPAVGPGPVEPEREEF